MNSRDLCIVLRGDVLPAGGAEYYIEDLASYVVPGLFDSISVLGSMVLEKATVPVTIRKRSDPEPAVWIVNGWPALRFLPATKKPVILIHHGMSLLPTPLDPKAFLSLARCGGIPARMRLRLATLSLPANARTTLTLRDGSERVTRVVSVDAHSLRFVPSTFLHKWVVIRNAVDVHRFLAHPPPERTVEILVPRNLRLERGVLWIPRLAHGLRREFGSLRWTIVGEGPLESPIRAELKALRLLDVVRLQGHMSRAEMPDLYSQSALVLVPSIYGEGTSLAVLEGMASSRVVVSTDVGGLQELGLNRVHIVRGSPSLESIAENIKWCLLNPSECERIRVNARSYAEEFHPITVWSAKWRKLLSTVTEN